MPTFPLPLFAPEDSAPRGQNPPGLLHRIAGLANSRDPDARTRLRSIGEWLYGVGGDDALTAAREAVTNFADNALDLGTDIDLAWQDIGLTRPGIGRS